MRVIKYILPLLLLVFTSGVFAQNRILIQELDSYVSERDQIRNIKLSGDYYYFDAINSDLLQAKASAIALLGAYISRLDVTTHLNADSLLLAKGQTIWVPRGERYMVVAYIAKADFLQQHIAETKVDSVVKVISKIEQPTMLDSIVSITNVEHLKNIFSELHSQHKIMFGPMAYLASPNLAYIVLFNERGDIIAILEPGEGARKDLKSGKMCNLEAFDSNLSKVWFIMY